ncbi:hypothetical protein ABZZ79_18255 [Streptomyces sp. NPDC006458]|uniref:hypothetical protein n=1 Tax=Streptomyces sp. NPDC006458 TaxID=3154302 RepID=UPI0033B1C2EE
MTYVQWPDFRLDWLKQGYLRFTWDGYCVIECDARSCVEVRLVPQESDGTHQWIFRLRMDVPLTPGLVVVRADVPPERLLEAQEVTELLRKRLRLPAHQEEETEPAEEAAPLERVPLDSPDWIAAPAGPASEELFGAVMANIAESGG